MRSSNSSAKATKTAAQGQAGSYSLRGELNLARQMKEGHKGPFNAMVGKRFKATGAAGQQVAVVYYARQAAAK